ncbi:CRE-GLB-32 protein [Ditylenchus destructor]|uniref:CRE-GLB-32 protein n=1 Tax=Ditylenchus destructor TaxID=166010 RepID=A0AAD4ND65_9BILA|nr:CRE-GLB-32 protein [Ditylenchus destructor]
MGNHTSFSQEQQNSDQRLLRRNMRLHSAAQPNLQTSILAGNGSRPSIVPQDSQRQSRSRSLEPKSTQEIRVIEHSKSARYTGKNKKLPKLWDPDEHRMLMIKQQLQNPTSVSPQPSLADQYEELRKQMFKKKSKAYQSIDMDNLTEQDQAQRSLTGLTVHQTQILQKIWTRASESDVADCSQNIFAHLLRSSLQMYEFFNLIGMTDKEVLMSTIFARQSANFAMVFDFVITNMADDVERVCFALQCLGERHARLKFPVEQNHWALFTRVFEDNPPKIVFQNPEGHTVWKMMVSFIIIQMRIGCNRAMAAKTENAATTSRPPPSPIGSTPRSRSAQSRRSQQRSKRLSSDSKRSTTLT